MAYSDSGYYRQPTIAGDLVIFVCETDLWAVEVGGGLARRLTAHQVDASWPQLAPDGRSVAFSATEHGVSEVYLMAAAGGHAERLTFHGRPALACAFTPDGTRVVYASDAEQPFTRLQLLRTVACTGGPTQALPFGPARRIAYGPNGAVAITRLEQEISRWKRYRGGTRSDLWVDARGTGDFVEILRDFPGNLGSPCWVGARLYFVADHEGHGNIYSCLPDGSDLQRCTHHEDFYARALNSDGRRLVYQCGGEIYLYDPEIGEARRLAIQINSSKPQLSKKFVNAWRYMQDYDLHPEGHSLLITSRGKPFALGNWEREVVQLGERQGVRYRQASWLHDGQRIVAVSDSGGEEALEVHAVENEHGVAALVERLDGLDTGRIRALTTSPCKDAVVIGNHRCEVIYIDLATKQLTVLDRSGYDDVHSLSFSPDGRYVAYAATKKLPFAQIYIADTETAEVHPITEAAGNDASPVFDPDGKYLYFLSSRVFEPVPDGVRFDLGFPKSTRPYLVALRDDLESPFHPQPKPLEGGDKRTIKAKSEDKKSEDKKEDAEGAPAEKAKAKVAAVKIDFAGIERRIVEFPIGESRYRGLVAAKGKIFFMERPLTSNIGEDPAYKIDHGARLIVYDLEHLKADVYAEGVLSLTLSRDGKTLAYQTRDRLRVVKAMVKPEAKEARPGRASGWIDSERIRVGVVPQAEWRQMFRELWRLQRDHFWTADLSQVDWAEVYARYLPILDKVATRSEFSDLVWEVQGELGTSHAYESGGDVRQVAGYAVGKLGADLKWDGEHWRIEKIAQGLSWARGEHSPLAVPGLGIKTGDRLLAVDGLPLSAEFSPSEALVHKAGVDVSLVVQTPGVATRRRLVVKPLGGEQALRYRAWVEANLAHVHQRTDQRIGYVHVPTMGSDGYAEFFRYFLRESYKDGLIVDVRFNGGGNVSQFLLEKLMRRRLSYMVSHHRLPMPGPHYSVEGPIFALTNELAGSDGDVFCHSFKMLKLGPLIGRRTWGGVVGIDSRNRLADGTSVTQPEYSTWFKDVGWGVENYGTDPDVEVLISPQDHAAGRDAQLEKAIDMALMALAQEPPQRPDFGGRPNLARPRLKPKM